MIFTEPQLRQYAAFEKVRLSGRYNMFDPRAGTAASLNREEQLFVIKNYTDLRRQAEAATDSSTFKLPSDMPEKERFLQFMHNPAAGVQDMRNVELFEPRDWELIAMGWCAALKGKP